MSRLLPLRIKHSEKIKVFFDSFRAYDVYKSCYYEIVTTCMWNVGDHEKQLEWRSHNHWFSYFDSRSYNKSKTGPFLEPFRLIGPVVRHKITILKFSNSIMQCRFTICLVTFLSTVVDEDLVTHAKENNYRHGDLLQVRA